MSENKNENNNEKKSDEEIIEQKDIPRDPKKVVVGMTGGVDSTVAAFLLQKQGYSCIGLSLLLINEEEIVEKISRIIQKREQDENSTIFKNGKKSNSSLEIKEATKFLKSSCSAKELDRIKMICDHLEIPHYGVNAINEYTDLILESLISSRVSGEEYSSCVDCHALKISILYQKADLLNAEYVATGHYAKVYRNESLKYFQLFCSNDLLHDQSMLLSKLKQPQLERLLLPLSDLRQVDVAKINTKFKLYGERKRNSLEYCFSKYDLSYLMEISVHQSLRVQGNFFRRSDDASLGEHLGIHKYWYGQSDLKGREGIGQHQIDKECIITDIFPTGKIYIGYKEDITFRGCGICDLLLTPHTDLTKPMEVFIQTELGSSEKIGAALYFKTLETALLVFQKPIYGLVIGQHLAFYDRRHEGAKVLGGGKIYYLDDINSANRSEVLERLSLRKKMKKDELKSKESEEKRDVLYF